MAAGQLYSQISDFQVGGKWRDSRGRGGCCYLFKILIKHVSNWSCLWSVCQGHSSVCSMESTYHQGVHIFGNAALSLPINSLSIRGSDVYMAGCVDASILGLADHCNK